MSAPRVALAHLFATGPHHPGGPHGLIHLGLLPLSAGAPPQHWLLNPGREFGKAIQEAACIGRKDVRSCPTWEQSRSVIQAAFAQFDALLILDRAGQPGPERHWLEQVVLEGLTKAPVCIGLDELTAFFLPAEALDDADDLLERLLFPDEAWQERIGYTRSSPRLPFILHAMRRALHRTLESLLRPHGGAEGWQPAFALLDALVRPLEEARRLPGELRALRLLRALARTPDCCDEPSASSGQKELPLRRLTPPPDRPPAPQPAQVRRLLAAWLTEWRSRSADTGSSGEVEIATPMPPTGAELSAVFKYLGEHRPDWKPRAAQQQYAAFVARAIGARGPYALEAGTGTGKTFGYLVPALEYLRKTAGGRVIVATSTKNLQDQILTGELPALLGPPNQRNPLYRHAIRAAVLKGKNCYVCCDALARSFSEAFKPGAPWRDGLAWLYLALRLRDTEGEIEGIAPQVSQRLGPALWQLLRATTADRACRHEASNDLPECTYPVHRRRAEAANLIITNHHKLALLPPKVRDNGGICIIDEADRFPDNFRGALSQRFDAREVYDDVIGVLLGGRHDETGRYKTGLLARLDERLDGLDKGLAAQAYVQTDSLMSLTPEMEADPAGTLDRQLEWRLEAALTQADLWTQAAGAVADTPLAGEAEAERDRHLEEAANLAGHLRQWRAVRAIRAATHRAVTPLETVAYSLRSMGAALAGRPSDGAQALPYPPDTEMRWQERFDTWEPERGRRWHQLDEQLLLRLRILAPLLDTAAAALAPLREQAATALPAPVAAGDERKLADDPDKSLRERSARAALLALETARLVGRMLLEFPCRAQIHTIQRDGNPRDLLAWRLTRQPYDLAPHLFAYPDPETGRTPSHLPAEPVAPLLDTFRTVVFTSATLYVDDRLDYFRRLLDLPVAFEAEARIRSPFHYGRAAIGAMAGFLAPYDSGWPKLEKGLWQQAALQTLLPMLVALDGRALVLFTSNEEMRAAADWLAPRLAAHDIELLVQNGASQWEIRRFRRVEQSVLLGVDRMWTGVDFAGLTLAHVVVWRAPFPMVGDPLISHRKQYETPDAYWNGFYYPSTRLKLRQGFGRLIRRETDRGVFTLLDSRLSSGRKHHHLLAELEIPLREYGSAEALGEGLVPEALRLLRLGEEFRRRGWSVARLLGAEAVGVEAGGYAG